MKKNRLSRTGPFLFVTIILLLTVSFGITRAEKSRKTGSYTGSQSCRECHEKFYQLWAPSHHGLAMQPYTAELAQKELRPRKDRSSSAKLGYRAVIDPGKGYVLEQGPQGKKTYKIAHVLGGKNVYYFLTPFSRGRSRPCRCPMMCAKKSGSTPPAAGSAISPDGVRMNP